MSTAQTLYAWVTRLAVPLASLYLTYRARKQPDYSKHWEERFGWKSFPKPEDGVPRLWVHAVSLGETVATRPLIEAFLAAHADAQILLTCMTPTGRDAGAKIAEKFPGRIVQCYLPYDTPELMGKFFDDTRPTMGVVMETEVWPNLLIQAQKRNISVVLANARESEKSAKLAERFIAVMRPAFAAFKAVLAQSQGDADRLQALGAQNIHVCGSMKFDLKADVEQVAKAHAQKEKFARPVILLASTRDTEEAMFMESIRTYKGNALVLLVPRHPQRFNDVARLLKDNDIAFVRKSEDP
ncbi:MAG: glycosyltransferase N-terminal domain-containing protein, partial [Sutterellaceae bacterium]|nr:glycosyltransferase N-terminal domain-containing protein [Sutterellaceae bacterium]